MELASFAALHPRVQPELRLLTLDLDHGKANEMGSRELDAFEGLCEFLENNEGITCLCTTSRRLSAKGKPIFIAGANVTERSAWEPARVSQHVKRQRELMLRLRNLPLFTMVVTHGVTLGWGVEYLLSADYTLATVSASFALPETGLGIVPGARGTAELAALIGPAQAMRLGCTGETIDANEALRVGLVQEKVDDLAAGLARVDVIAGLLMRRSPTAVAAFKRGVLQGMGREAAARVAIESQAYELCVRSGEAAIGRQSFAEVVAGQTPTWGPRRC